MYVRIAKVSTGIEVEKGGYSSGPKDVDVQVLVMDSQPPSNPKD